MLAPNFLPAEALQITEEQHTALVKTLGAFERGEIRDFYMGAWECMLDESGCGTMFCIGGWAEHLSRPGIFPNEGSHHKTLAALFYPLSEVAMSCRDPAIGALALRNYLTRGDPCWELVG